MGSVLPPSASLLIPLLLYLQAQLFLLHLTLSQTQACSSFLPFFPKPIPGCILHSPWLLHGHLLLSRGLTWSFLVSPRTLAKSFTSLSMLEMARTEKLGMGISSGEEPDRERNEVSVCVQSKTDEERPIRHLPGRLEPLSLLEVQKVLGYPRKIKNKVSSSPQQSFTPLGNNMHLRNAPAKGVETWPYKCETLSKFFLLD